MLNEGTFIISEGFITNLKNKIYKHTTQISKNVSVHELDHIVHKYNNTYYRTIKMKPVDVKQSKYIDSSKKINEEVPKHKVGEFVRTSKYKNISAKRYVSNWSEAGFVIKKVNNTVPWTYIISNLKDEETFETFYENELQRKNKKDYGVEKLANEKERNYVLNGKAKIVLLTV